MESSVAALVLFSALLHAGWNALLKVRGEPLVVLALISASANAIALFTLPFLPLPPPVVWPFLGISVLFHTGYNVFLAQSYRHGDLGHVYPIARGTAPLIVAIASRIVVGETLHPLTVLAVLLIAIGVISLAFGGERPIWDYPHPVLFALATSFFVAAYTLVDGIAGRMVENPHVYPLWLFSFLGFPISALALAKHRRSAIALARERWKTGLSGGAMPIAAYGLIIWAMTVGNMAPVAALRETSVIFAAVLGWVFLREPYGRLRLVAAAFVAAGAILLRIS